MLVPPGVCPWPVFSLHTLQAITFMASLHMKWQFLNLHLVTLTSLPSIRRKYTNCLLDSSPAVSRYYPFPLNSSFFHLTSEASLLLWTHWCQHHWPSHPSLKSMSFFLSPSSSHLTGSPRLIWSSKYNFLKSVSSFSLTLPLLCVLNGFSSVSVGFLRAYWGKGWVIYLLMHFLTVSLP